MAKRTRWPPERLARAAFLCGLGLSAPRIAKDATIVSKEASVREHLYAIGLRPQPEGQLERLVAVPVRYMPTMAAVARARGRCEMAEDVVAKVVAVLTEVPAMVGDILNGDVKGFDGRLRRGWQAWPKGRDL